MKTKPLPKWAMKKYAQLWKRFKQEEFDYEKASALLKEKNSNLISVLFNYLRKYNWIDVKLNPVDTRKRIYKLYSPEKIMEEIAK